MTAFPRQIYTFTGPAKSYPCKMQTPKAKNLSWKVNSV